MTLVSQPGNFEVDKLTLHVEQTKIGHYKWTLTIQDGGQHYICTYDRGIVALGPEGDTKLYKLLIDLLTDIFDVDIKFD